jgi:hypothetical protein
MANDDTVPTECNLTESEPRANLARFAPGSLGRTQNERRADPERTQSGPRVNPELTQNECLKRTQIFTSGPSKRSRVLHNRNVNQSCCKLIG